MAKGHKQTQTHAADAATTGMQGQVYDAAKKAAGGYTTVGPDAGQTAAMGHFGDAANLGMGGMGALAGDPEQIAKLMNPYISNVLGGYNSEYAKNDSLLANKMSDEATQAGAFGGDRASLASGAARGELGAGHMAQVADLLHGGYNDAMARAGGLASLGLGAAGSQFEGGGAMRDIAQQQANPELARQQILANGLQTGNVGNSTDTSYQKTGAMQNIMGALSTGASLFGGKMPDFGSMAAGLFGNSAAVRQAGMRPPGPVGKPTGFFGGR